MLQRRRERVLLCATGLAASSFLPCCGHDAARTEAPSPGVPAATAPAAHEPPAAGAATAAASARPPVSHDWSPYGWLAAEGAPLSPPTSTSTPAPVDTLAERFPPPDGFRRVEQPAGSFGAWLQGLPLAAEGTPVRSYKGDSLREMPHHGVAAVFALDIGKGDLQQCADSIIRLHAEWQWSRGGRAMSYRSASKQPLPFARWARGERVVPQGSSLSWETTGKAVADRPTFRKYLDAVFNWTNTVALGRDAAPVALDQLRPGDFFILGGNPGHTVLVVDMAQAPDGRRSVLLGQGFMPAQNFQLLKDVTGSPWFAIEPAQGSVKTPFWEAFPWSSLRRMSDRGTGD